MVVAEGSDVAVACMFEVVSMICLVFTGSFLVVMYRMMGVSGGADSTIWRLNQAKARVPRQEAALGGEDGVGGGQQGNECRLLLLVRCRPVGKNREAMLRRERRVRRLRRRRRQQRQGRT